MGYELLGEKIVIPSTPVPDINNDHSLTAIKIKNIGYLTQIFCQKHFLVSNPN